MAQYQPVDFQPGQRGIAGVPRSRLDAAAGRSRRGHLKLPKSDAQPRTQGLAERAPVVGAGIQAVMDMSRAQSEVRTRLKPVQRCSSTTESTPPERPTQSLAPGAAWRASEAATSAAGRSADRDFLNLPYAMRRSETALDKLRWRQVGKTNAARPTAPCARSGLPHDSRDERRPRVR